MEQHKIDRINELARHAKKRELTAEEKTEREALRSEYRAAVRQSLSSALENTYIMDEHGNKTRLKKKDGGK